MVAAEAAAGLAALHTHGAVHSGVEPEALVQTGDGTVKLCGAGLAGRTCRRMCAREVLLVGRAT